MFKTLCGSPNDLERFFGVSTSQLLPKTIDYGLQDAVAQTNQAQYSLLRPQQNHTKRPQ